MCTAEQYWVRWIRYTTAVLRRRFLTHDCAGALLGCAHGASAVPASFKSGLHAATAIEAEVQAFVESVSRLHDE